MKIILGHDTDPVIKVRDITEHHIVLIKPKTADVWGILRTVDFHYSLIPVDSFLRLEPLLRDGGEAASLEAWLSPEYVEEAHAFNTFKEACEFLIERL